MTNFFLLRIWFGSFLENEMQNEDLKPKKMRNVRERVKKIHLDKKLYFKYLRFFFSQNEMYGKKINL